MCELDSFGDLIIVRMRGEERSPLPQNFSLLSATKLTRWTIYIQNNCFLHNSTANSLHWS